MVAAHKTYVYSEKGNSSRRRMIGVFRDTIPAAPTFRGL